MPGKSGDIYFHYLVKPFFFPGRTQAKAFIKTILHEHRKEVDAINYIFCSDKYLLTINKKYLKHNYYTDIITFELAQEEGVTADVFISVDRMRINASAFKVSTSSEIMRLLIHGALHLCGYKDKNSAQSKRMKQLEEYYLDKYFVSRETNPKN